MPNHVRTVVKFRNLKGDGDKLFLLRMLARNLKETDDLFTPDHPDYIMDFNKIIPEPRTIEECPESCIRTESSYVEEDTERPWFDWYKWRIHHWDTKWGAYDGYTEQGNTFLTFVFSTAWSLALPIMEKLTRLGYDFTVYYADEDYGANCGKIIYNAKSNEWTHLTEKEVSSNPTNYAKRIWDRY